MFVVFGEPDVAILDEGGAEIRVRVNGVYVLVSQYRRHPLERH